MNDTTTNAVSVGGIGVGIVGTAVQPANTTWQWISLGLTIASTLIVIIVNIVKLYKSSDNLQEFGSKLKELCKKFINLFKKGNKND